jgi:hypothetical protein
MPYKYPFYRISVNTRSMNPPVYLFYRVDGPKDSFFSYPDANDPIGQELKERLETLKL